MRRFVILTVLAMCVVHVAGALPADAFQRLDNLIATQPAIVAEKEARLTRMKADLARETSAAGRYSSLRRLYEEYSAYQYDSAYAYVSQCINLAQAMGNESLLNESRLNLAHILSTACLMDKARLTLSQVDTTRLSPSQLILYHRTRIDLLIYQAEYMQGTQYAEECVRQLVGERRAAAAVDVPRDDVNSQITLAPRQ